MPGSHLPAGGTRHRADDELIQRLRGEGPRRDAAAAELHDMLLRAARFEIRRRGEAVARLGRDEVEDLALQAADDAFVAVMAKLDEFRGDSRFSTWVYKFALYEAAARVRRRSWQQREVTIDEQHWLQLSDDGLAPDAHAQQTELLDAIRVLVGTCLTPHQREVLIALAIQGIPIDVLAERRRTTRGALYKTLHDARRRLRAELTAAGHDLEADR